MAASTETGTIDANAETVPTAQPYINWRRPFLFMISGTWVGTIALRISYDNGSNWVTLKSYTGNPTEAEQFDFGTADVRLRAEATAWTSGSASIRFGEV